MKLADKCKTTFQYRGVDWKARPHIDRIFDGEYNIPSMKVFAPLVLDIGANVGAYSFWASHRYQEALILAYEPHPDNANYFRENTLNLGWLKLTEVAVYPSDKPEIDLFISPYNSGAHSLDQKLNGSTGSAVTVKTLHPSQLPEADVIKLDTEGCEKVILEVYMSNIKDFWRQPKIISYEYHRTDDYFFLKNLLESHEYKLYNHEIATGKEGAPIRGTMNWFRK